MNAGRRYEIPGLRQRNSKVLKAQQVAKALSSVPLAPTPKSHGNNEGALWMPCIQWVCFAFEEQENGEPTSFIEDNKQAFVLEREITLFLKIAVCTHTLRNSAGRALKHSYILCMPCKNVQ